MTPERRAGNWKPKEIRLPLNKMAGCPWNLLDARGARVAWCGYDNDHERTGELIANDILNLVAIGEAVGELLDTASDNLLKAQAEIDRLTKEIGVERAQAFQDFAGMKKLYTTEIDRLTAENQQYRTQYVTRTAYEAVKEHLDDKQAEIDRLNKVVDQAIELTHMRRYKITSEPNFICAHKVQMQHVESVPELAAELERRSKA